MGLLNSNSLNEWATAIPDRARQIYAGLLDAPRQVGQLFDPKFQKGLLDQRSVTDRLDMQKAMALALDVMPNPMGLIGMTKKVTPLAYQIDHKPMNEGASRLHDLTTSFGEDIYGPNAMQYYGSGMPEERKMLRMMQKLRGNPDEMVTIYRGVPAGVDKINPGDWVTLDKQMADYYANPEAYGAAGKGAGRVLEMKVPAKHITSWPDSLAEFGYFPD